MQEEEKPAEEDENEKLINGMINALDVTMQELQNSELWQRPNFFYHYIEIEYKRMMGPQKVINSPYHLCNSDKCKCVPLKVCIIKRVTTNDILNMAFAEFGSSKKKQESQLLLTEKAHSGERIKPCERLDLWDIRNYEIILMDFVDVRYVPFLEKRIANAKRDNLFLELKHVYVCQTYGKIHACGEDTCVLSPKIVAGMTICPITGNSYGVEIDGEKPYQRPCVEDDEENEEAEKEKEFMKAVEADGKEAETPETRYILVKSVIELLLISDQRQLRESDKVLDAYQKFMEQFGQNCRKQFVSDKLSSTHVFSARMHALATMNVGKTAKYFSRFPVNPNIRGHIRSRLLKIADIIKARNYGKAKGHEKNDRAMTRAHFDVLDRRKNELLSELRRSRPPSERVITRAIINDHLKDGISWMARVIVDRWGVLEHYNQLDAKFRKKRLGFLRYRIIPLLYMFIDGCYIQDPFDRTKNINVIPKIEIAKYLPPANKIEEYSDFCAISLRNLSFTESFNEIKEFFTVISTHLPDLFLSSSSTSTR